MMGIIVLIQLTTSQVYYATHWQEPQNLAGIYNEGLFSRINIVSTQLPVPTHEVYFFKDVVACKMSLAAKFCGKFTHRNNNLIRFLICIVYTLSMSDNSKFNLNLKEIPLKVCNEYL